MLNEKNQRELAYIVTIEEIRPIPNYDRVEHARTAGWWVIVKKDQFKVGDPAIYIEVDSKVPEQEPFMFLENKHFRIKTQKMCKVLSQGLLMAPVDFGWTVENGKVIANGRQYQVGDFLTEILSITYADATDNIRKAPSVDKYKKMASRHPKLFKTSLFRKLMKTEWGKRILFVFFGKAKDKKNAFPYWVKKTDEERCQNMPWILEDKNPWIATEKVDGSSATYTLKRRRFGKPEFIVCSRNVVQDTPEKQCYYDSNIYWEIVQKYNIENALRDILAQCPNADYVTLQGEVFGEGVQKRDYKIVGRDFRAFNLIFSNTGRINSVDMKEILEDYGIPSVPIIDENFILPDTVEELLQIATGNSVIDGGMREGLVFRSKDGARSFKAVSNEFLLAFHS